MLTRPKPWRIPLSSRRPTDDTASGSATRGRPPAAAAGRAPRRPIAGLLAPAGSLPSVEVADSVLDLVGNTPLVRVRRAIPEARCDVLAKLEMLNPGGSVKDRIAVAMIDAAEREGLLEPGGTIIEPTSGNTGVGLAMVAAQRGYRCIFVMTDKVSGEKVQLLRAYGAFE